MSTFARIYGSSGRTLSFDDDEMTDTAQIKPSYGVQIGQKETAGSEIRQQIRPGLRFVKTYAMALPQAKYILFCRLITDGSSDYFIEFTEAPSLLANDDEALAENNFAISLSMDVPDGNAGNETVYYFNLGINSISLI